MVLPSKLSPGVDGVHEQERPVPSTELYTAVDTIGLVSGGGGGGDRKDSLALWSPAGLYANQHLRYDEAMVDPPRGTPNRLYRWHFLLVSPSDEEIAQQVSLMRPRMHPDGLLSHRQAEEHVRQDDSVFSAGTSNDPTSQPIAGIHTFDLPSVWLGDIALWPRIVESRLALRQISLEDTKFPYVVAVLSMDIATDLRDIIDCPPTEAPYTALKEALISGIYLSTQKRL
ncbi:hypothetical protein SprV_0501890100 [Sparganum proliferum]